MESFFTKLKKEKLYQTGTAKMSCDEVNGVSIYLQLKLTPHLLCL